MSARRPVLLCVWPGRRGDVSRVGPSGVSRAGRATWAPLAGTRWLGRLSRASHVGLAVWVPSTSFGRAGWLVVANAGLVWLLGWRGPVAAGTRFHPCGVMAWSPAAWCDGKRRRGAAVSGLEARLGSGRPSERRREMREERERGKQREERWSNADKWAPPPRGVHVIKTALQNSRGRENAQVQEMRGLEYPVSDSRREIELAHYLRGSKVLNHFIYQ